jgi:CheY-like chemotaxis protein
MTEIGSGDVLPGSSAYTETMPADFVGQVRDLLAHLYDLAYLSTLAIVKERAMIQQRPLRSVAASIKQEVMDLLESLNPGHAFYFRAPEARTYHILLLHYVERHTVLKAADELGISERQAYRDLRQAETDLARLLWQRHQYFTLTQTANTHLMHVPQIEDSEVVDLRDLLTAVTDIVRPLAATASTPMALILPEQAIFLMLNLPVARQVLIALLSQVIQSAESGVTIAAAASDAAVEIRLEYTPHAASSEMQTNAVTQSMADRLGWQLTWRASDLTIQLPQTVQKKILLCIDDDASFSELLRRYLTGYPALVLSATSGRQGIEQILQSPPDIVILDVMMAGLDGWETLQRIRTHPAMQHLPIIVCSVFDNPELAYSLGATAILAKPLSPGDFLQTLERLEII